MSASVVNRTMTMCIQHYQTKHQATYTVHTVFPIDASSLCLVRHHVQVTHKQRLRRGTRCFLHRIELEIGSERGAKNCRIDVA